MAMAQPSTGTSRRPPTVGACCRAPVPRRPLCPDVCRLAHGLDGRNDVPRSHDQGLARDRRAAAGNGSGSVGAAVDRGVAHGCRLCARRCRAHPYRCRAASPHCQTQRRAAAHDLERAPLTSAQPRTQAAAHRADAPGSAVGETSAGLRQEVDPHAIHATFAAATSLRRVDVLQLWIEAQSTPIITLVVFGLSYLGTALIFVLVTSAPPRGWARAISSLFRLLH